GGGDRAAIAMVTERVRAEAAQPRLKVDGGWPWETFHTERAIYRIQHSGAPWKSRAFRTLSMVPALLLPPQWFYAGRHWLGERTWYKRVRKGVLPAPRFAQVGSPPASDRTSAVTTLQRKNIF